MRKQVWGRRRGDEEKGMLRQTSCWRLQLKKAILGSIQKHSKRGSGWDVIQYVPPLLHKGLLFLPRCFTINLCVCIHISVTKWGPYPCAGSLVLIVWSAWPAGTWTSLKTSLKTWNWPGFSGDSVCATLFWRMAMRDKTPRCDLEVF